MAKFLSSILFGIVWIFSLLPLPVLYLFSDIIWLLMYIFPPLRYRKSIVRNNLSLSFPDKSKRWLRRTERRFYYQFACQFVEALKTVSAGKRWILRHMEFTGMDKLVQETINGRSGIGYLGHVGNWEWIPSMNLFFTDVNDFVGGQVYHSSKHTYGAGHATFFRLQERRQEILYRNDCRSSPFVVEHTLLDQVPE